MCHVTKYSTILGVKSQGLLQSAVLNEEKALGMRLISSLSAQVAGFPLLLSDLNYHCLTFIH